MTQQNQGQQGQQGQQGWQQHGQQGQWRESQDTVVSITTVLPNPSTFSRLSEQFQTAPGIREVALLRGGSTPAIRVEVSAEALPNITQVLQQIVQPVQQAYAGSFSGGSF